MNHHGLLARIARAGGAPFESPGRGAVCISRLSWGLPISEQVPGLSDAQRAHAAIMRTIRHPHTCEHRVGQYGGDWFSLVRHVTLDGERWTFTVEVELRPDGSLVIDDANLVRPGDADDDDDSGDGGDGDGGDGDGDGGGGDGDGDPAGRVAADLGPPQLPLGVVACPCCGRATLSSRGAYQICPVCFWEDDGQDSADADVERGGPNPVSLTTGRKNYLAFGASVPADRDKVRRPVDEELPLRRFDADGRERPGA
jgi:hypothetical protein